MTHIIYEPIKQQGKFIRKKSIEQILQRKKNRGEKSHQEIMREVQSCENRFRLVLMRDRRFLIQSSTGTFRTTENGQL